MKHLPPYETPEMQTICLSTDVITTSFTDSLPFLPTGQSGELNEDEL